jgi:ABC-type transporter Mla subunit MlaD
MRRAGCSPPGSRRAAPRRGSRSRCWCWKSSSSSLSFGTPTSALTTMQSQITELGQANLAFTANVNEPTRRLLGTTRTSIGGLADSTRRSIDSSTTNVNRAVDRLNRSIDRSLGGFTKNIGEAVAVLRVDLRQATAPSLKTIAASAAKLQLTTNQIKSHTDALAAQIAPVAAQVDGLVTQLQAPVQTSTGLVQHLAQVNADLDALNGADKTDPTFLKLVADVAAAQQVANTVNSELLDLQQRAQEVAQGVHTLQPTSCRCRTRSPHSRRRLSRTPRARSKGDSRQPSRDWPGASRRPRRRPPAASRGPRRRPPVRCAGTGRTPSALPHRHERPPGRPSARPRRTPNAA